MTRALALSLVALTVVAVRGQSDAQAVQRMVATERAFAAATAEIGVRDGFLTFFADDAVQINAGSEGSGTTLVHAKEALQKLPLPKLPLPARLMWEPFTGQISADGSLGWLTGAYVSLTQATHDIAGQGAYFSVWKRQVDGTWRVWLDEGVSLPQTWNDASPFRAAPEPDSGTTTDPVESIEAAERSVLTAGAPWRSRLSAAVRLHRDGRMPLATRDDVVAWASRNWTNVRYTVVSTQAAASGDLAITLGGYDTTGGAPEHGTFVRVWKRDVTGRWRIVFETSKPVK